MWIAIAAVAASVSAVMACVALIMTQRYQKEQMVNSRKTATISAFGILQREVLDSMLSIDEDDVEVMAEGHVYSEEAEQAYDEYKAMLARCEQFAVGVNSGVYDIGTVNEIAGTHLINLYSKFLPVIDETRHNNEDGGKTFVGYEKMVEKLKTMTVG